MFIFDKRRPSLRREDQKQINSQIKIKSPAGFARRSKGWWGRAPPTLRQLGDPCGVKGRCAHVLARSCSPPVKLGAARAAASGRAPDPAYIGADRSTMAAKCINFVVLQYGVKGVNFTLLHHFGDF